jgi:hypothetical protein
MMRQWPTYLVDIVVLAAERVPLRMRPQLALAAILALAVHALVGLHWAKDPDEGFRSQVEENKPIRIQTRSSPRGAAVPHVDLHGQ